MAQCTAPYRGHRTASGRANCPACGGRGGYRSSYSYSVGSSYGGSGRSGYGTSSGGSGGGSRRTRTGRSVSYTPTEWRTVEPFTEKASEQAQAHPERHDLFL